MCVSIGSVGLTVPEGQRTATDGGLHFPVGVRQGLSFVAPHYDGRLAGLRASEDCGTVDMSHGPSFYMDSEDVNYILITSSWLPGKCWTHSVMP